MWCISMSDINSDKNFYFGWQNLNSCGNKLPAKCVQKQIHIRKSVAQGNDLNLKYKFENIEYKNSR